jgi:LacI family transcriptional regulator
VAMDEVARIAGVSKSTVSRAINHPELVGAATRERVRAALEAVGFTPNATARALRSGVTQIVAVLVPDVKNPFYTSALRGIEDVASELGYMVIVCNTDELPSKERQYLVKLDGRIDGVIITSASEDEPNLDVLAKLRNVVALSRGLGGGAAFDWVKLDNRQGAYQAVSRLIEAGHERIAILAGPTVTTTGRERLEGYEQALHEHGIALDDELVCIGDYTRESGYEMATSLLAQPTRGATAVFSCSNFITLGLLQAAAERQLEVPRQLSIVGFDEVPAADLIKPGLTTVLQPTYDMGKASMRLLLRRIQNAQANHDAAQEPKTIVLSPTFVERGSVASPAAPTISVDVSTTSVVAPEDPRRAAPR